MSIKGNENDRVRTGTTKDLIASHRDPQHEPILNALDFPFSVAPTPPLSIASDVVAWKNTVRCPGCAQEYPTPSVRWGTGSTMGAYHPLHTDTEGFATYADCKVGSKWWVVGYPVDESGPPLLSDYSDMAHIMENDGVPPKHRKLRFEAILLTPGTRL